MAARSEAHDGGLCGADADTLLANAARHAPESSPIRIAAAQGDARVATTSSLCPEGLFGGGAPS